MITIFIDTSNQDVSIALIKGDKVIDKLTEDTNNKHSKILIPYIKDMLTKNNIEPKNINKVMVVNGPGSFTGIRIGLTVAKTIGYVLNIPVITVSSLKILAISCEEEIIISIIDARNDNYYIGVYDQEKQEIEKEQFNNLEYLLKLKQKYPSSIVVANKKIQLEAIQTKVPELNFEKIYQYYSEKTPTNIHSIKPNYLKLPQAMERKSD
ncbi:MAG: tRNA (adenosine(37)-N6)-threonylcarbamoyltransferase complex dimerization subunit type 1 TsaB [bacterium]|nr:tRNA (adenosine(37)-N6)-threonylcarbamoyltransferase complex dimerization subunit type 1 TsaB [bacterium]